jgi:hypothetical protein
MTIATKARPKDKPAARRANIIESMDGIFLPWFPRASDGTDTWAGWKAVLKAMDVLPMTADEIEFFKSIAGGREPPTRRVSELVAACARRTGKDSIASLVAAYGAATFDQQDRLRPGERAQILCLACDRGQAGIVLGYIKAYFDRVPALKAMVDRETRDGFELNNGIDVTVATNSFRAVRGKPIFLAILDEAAFMMSETSASPDTELYAALKPALVTLPGSRIITISSPYRRAGLLWNQYKRFFGKDDPGTLVIQASVRQLNPTIPQSVVDAAIEEDAASASAEWLGQFRDDLAAFLTIELIESAVDHGVVVRPPSDRFRYWSFVDASGGVKDSFTLGIAHAEGDVAVLDHLTEIKAPLNPYQATAEISNTLKMYKLHATMGDRYAAKFTSDAFAANAIKYEHSERDRSAIYQDVLPLFTSGRIRLLDNRRLVNQFVNLERRTSPIGKDRIDHGPGGNDDCANSVSGALVRCIHEKSQRTRQIRINFMGR